MTCAITFHPPTNVTERDRERWRWQDMAATMRMDAARHLADYHATHDVVALGDYHDCISRMMRYRRLADQVGATQIQGRKA